MAPNAICQDITVQLDAAGNATITTADVDNGSNENCSLTYSISASGFTCANIGANSVTLTATDGDANSASCESVVTVEDNVNPTVVCQDATVQLDAGGNASITTADVNNGSSDNCGASLSINVSNFICTDLGANNVTLTATDGEGNSNTCQSVVTVEDNISPTAVCQDITVQITSGGTASMAAGDIDGGSADNCTVSLSVSSSSFDCNDLGAYNVTLTATDGDGNSHSCQATVTITDPMLYCCSAPTAVCQDATILLNASGNGSVATGNVDGGSSTSCGVQSMSVSPNSFTCADLGDVNVTLSIVDNSNAITSCQATVTVSDNILPVISNCPDSINNNCSAIAAWTAPTASDNCNVTLDANHISGSLFPTGVTPVTYTATDDAGNMVTCVFNVTVYGLPTANAGGDPNICKGESITIGGVPTGSGGAGLSYSYVWGPTTGLSSSTVANPIANPTITTEYTVFVIDQTTGCAGTDIVRVGVIPELTPSGTGVSGQVRLNGDHYSSFTGGLGKSDEFGRALALSLIHI